MVKARKPAPPTVGDADIPDFLLVENRVPLTKEQQAKLDEDAQKRRIAIDKAYDPQRWDKPKGMSDDEYDAWKNRDRLEKKDKMTERFAKLRERKVPKADAPKDTFRLLLWAREAGLDPRLVRGVARANVDRLKPLETFGKYVYPNSVKDQVSKIIREGLEKKPSAKKPSTPEKPTLAKKVKAKPNVSAAAQRAGRQARAAKKVKARAAKKVKARKKK